MQHLIKIVTFVMCLIAMPASSQAVDGSQVVDIGVYPDSGCLDGICCLVLPDWDAGYYDIGVVDTGRRRRVVSIPDAGSESDDDSFGCSTSSVLSLMWLLPLAFVRRRY